MVIVYTGELPMLNHIPFHVNEQSESFIFKEDVLKYFMKNDKDIYQLLLGQEPLLLIHEFEVDGKVAFHLLAVLEASLKLYNKLCHKGYNSLTKEEEEVYSILYPFVLTLAKIGAKVVSNGFDKNETPITIFENEIKKGY